MDFAPSRAIPEVRFLPTWILEYLHLAENSDVCYPVTNIGAPNLANTNSRPSPGNRDNNVLTYEFDHNLDYNVHERLGRLGGKTGWPVKMGNISFILG